MPEQEGAQNQPDAEQTLDQEDLDKILETAPAVDSPEGDSDETDAGETAMPEGALPELDPSPPEASPQKIDLLMDVDLEVKIELGRAEMAIEDVLRLKKGSVVELDKLAGDPVDILVNNRRVARGEILVVNDNFCVRITEILDPDVGLKAAEDDNA